MWQESWRSGRPGVASVFREESQAESLEESQAAYPEVFPAAFSEE